MLRKMNKHTYLWLMWNLHVVYIYLGAPLQLLPPSSFKPPSPSPAAPSHVPQASPIPSPTVGDDGMRHALQTATQEIATLKLENAKLREAKAQTMYAAAEVCIMVPTDLEKCMQEFDYCIESAWFFNMSWKLAIFLEKYLKITFYGFEKL